METFKIVRPEHLNHQGSLFGGDILRWVDEYAWIAATRDFPGMRFVTIGIDKADFHKPAPLGALLRFVMEKDRVGKTSVSYQVTVFAQHEGGTDDELIFSTTVTFVRLDENGNKLAIN